MLAVTLEHTDSYMFYRHVDYPLVAILFSAFVRMAVPGFFIVSGFLAGRKKGDLSVSRFLVNKFQVIGVPMLVWGVIYTFVLHNFDLDRVFTWDSLMDVLIGEAGPQTYFLFVLLQLFVLYSLFRKVSWKLLLVVCLVIQTAFTIVSEIDLAIAGYDHRWFEESLVCVFPPWAAFFVLGIAVAQSERLRASIQKHRLTLLLLGGMTLGLLTINFLEQLTEFGRIIRRYFLIVSVVYQYCWALYFLLAAKELGKRLADYPALVRPYNAMAWAGRYTYAIYLNHYLMLVILGTVISPVKDNVPFPIEAPFLLSLVFFVSLGAAVLFELPVLSKIRPYLYGR